MVYNRILLIHQTLYIIYVQPPWSWRGQVPKMTDKIPVAQKGCFQNSTTTPTIPDHAIKKPVCREKVLPIEADEMPFAGRQVGMKRKRVKGGRKKDDPSRKTESVRRQMSSDSDVSEAPMSKDYRDYANRVLDELDC